MNKITAAIAKQKINIANRVESGMVTQAKVDALHKTLDLDFLEHAKFQEHKSFACGKLTLDEATSLYQLLGETPDTFNAQPIEVKSVLTQVFAELLEMAIRSRRKAS